ncbi:restriction endonuclease subunit S [uncultured Roseobacter sp.]|uniref:restriction endonuclease subunit S n=1 Tax=uncultured Roseobacter sp. TaxID=114847 RepID=UPI002608B233|nr:restriction endonuclease subunit S [uncultured Roseobacter sp.]
MNAVTLTSSFPATVQPGIPKLGDTPDGWARAPLGRFLHEVRRPIRMVDDEEYKLVTVKRARGGVVDRGSFLGRDVLVKSQYLIEPGDFLISKRQIVHGACGLVPDELGGSVVSNEYAVLNGTNEIDLKFLNYLAHSIFFQQTCFHSSIGVHVEKMIFKLDRWLNFEFDLPPLPEQRKIADILSTWDRAIEVSEALLSTARTQKRALMQSLLTGKRRFPEFEGQEWKEVRLGDVCKLQTGPFGSQLKAEEYSTHKDGVAVVMPKALINGSVDFSVCDFIEQERSNDLVKHRLLVGDLLFSRRGDVARTALVTEADGPCICGTGCLRARPSSFRLARFLSKLLQMEFCRSWLEENAVGQTMLNLNTKIIGALPIQVPCENEQEKIVAVFDDVDAQIEEHRLSIEKLRTEKKALMQQLLTGKRRVAINA